MVPGSDVNGVRSLPPCRAGLRVVGDSCSRGGKGQGWGGAGGVWGTLGCGLAPSLLQVHHSGGATGVRGTCRDWEVEEACPGSVWLAAAWRAGRIAHLFAESGLYARLLLALRWWTSGSPAAFWKGRGGSQIGHLVEQLTCLVVLELWPWAAFTQLVTGVRQGTTSNAMSPDALTFNPLTLTHTSPSRGGVLPVGPDARQLM